MRSLIYLSVLALVGASSVLLDGCSSSTSETVGQNIEDMAWLPDESGLVAYDETTSISQIDGSQAVTANIYHVSASGSIGNAIDASDQGITSDYPPLVFMSSDGKSVVTPFGANIFRVDLSSGNATNIIQNTSLYGASPDLHYVLTSSYTSEQTTKLLDIYDLTDNPIRLLSPQQTRVSTGNRILWIDNGSYAVTVADSILNNIPFNHVSIYDTSGNFILMIPDAAVALHASAYAPKSRDIFVETNELGIDKINLTAGLSSRTHIITNDSIESLDVSADGTLLVYTSGAINNNPLYPAYAVNVSNGHKAILGSSMVVPFISPNVDRVAFIHNSGDNNGDQDINVVGLSLPP